MRYFEKIAISYKTYKGALDHRVGKILDEDYNNELLQKTFKQIKNIREFVSQKAVRSLSSKDVSALDDIKFAKKTVKHPDKIINVLTKSIFDKKFKYVK